MESENEPTQENTNDVKPNEKEEEEAKLKAKYPSVARPGLGFLQKRLQKGVSLHFIYSILKVFLLFYQFIYLFFYSLFISTF